MDISLVMYGCMACGASALAVWTLLAPSRRLSVRESSSPQLPVWLARLEAPRILLQWLAEDARREHRSVCLAQMPEMLDVVTLGLSAGLSFDMALGLYCDYYSTELAQELTGSMLSWQLGLKTRAEELADFADTLDSAAARRFASSVSEALSFGSPLSSILEHQATGLREEQRSFTEEQIERAPVKMLIPLGTLIVPAMLLSILGPLLSGAIGLM